MEVQVKVEVEVEERPHLPPPPPPPGRGASAMAIAAVSSVAGGEPKRARKRSRYLSPPYYTGTGTEEVSNNANNNVDNEEPPPDVRAADALSALRATALQSLLLLDPDAARGLRFLTTYLYTRRSKALFANVPLPLHVPAAAAAAGVAHKPLSPTTGTGTAPGPVPSPPAGGSKQKQKQDPRQPPPPAATDTGVAADARKRKRTSRSSDVGTNNATPNLPAKNPKRRRKNKNRDDQTRLGTPRLVQDLGRPPVTTLDNKLPLRDVKSNLEKMILSLTTSRSSFGFSGSPEQPNKPAAPVAAIGNLVGEMQGLLAKVENMMLLQQRGSASCSTVIHRPSSS